jgi:hypothetical protein
MGELTDRAVLELESRFYRHAGAKAKAIAETFGCTEARYYQRLWEVVSAPSSEVALEFAAVIEATINKLGWDARLKHPA